MWGGMQLPSEQDRRPRVVPDQQPPPDNSWAKSEDVGGVRVPWLEVGSVFLLLTAVVLVVTGAALEWGVGGALLAAGVSSAVLGVLLAFAGSDA